MAKKKARLGNNPLDWIKDTSGAAEIEIKKEAKTVSEVKKREESGETCDGKERRLELLRSIKEDRIPLSEGLRLIKQLNREQCGAAVKTGEAPAGETLYFQEYWRESLSKSKQWTGGPADCFMIFSAAGEEFALIETRLREEAGDSARIVRVSPGERYGEERGDELVYEIDPAQPGDYRRLLESLRNRGLRPGKILHLWAEPGLSLRQDHIKRQLERGIYSIFYLSSALMEQKNGDAVRLLYVYPWSSAEPRPVYEAAGGFARTIRQENPKFIYKIIGLEGETSALFIDDLLGEWDAAASDDCDVRFNAAHKRLVKGYREINAGEGDKKSFPRPLRENGVYLVTGGLGGLGFIVAKYLAGQVKARLALTGRSPLNPARQEKIKQLENAGAQVIYIQSDVSGEAGTRELIARVKSRFNGLNGIIHSAGVIRDAYILKKTTEELAAVLAAKVYGTVNLDEAAGAEDLDFFVMFSSLSAVLGNVGQSDYAYANRFIDCFARLREGLRTAGKRRGKTFAIDWPYWLDSGMQLTGEDLALAYERTGLAAIPASEGVAALEWILQAQPGQWLVGYGNRDKIRQVFAGPRKREIQAPQAAVDPGVLLQKTGDFLKEVFAEILKLPVSRVNDRTDFEKYGIDSILVKMFNTRVEKELGPISRTLLFEYRNLRDLTGYFVDNHAPELIGKFLLVPAEPAKSVEKEAKRAEREARPSAPAVTAGAPRREDDIAIIGLSGRYPMAGNLEEFWDNLSSGRDCITEIPPERWDYRDYYDPDPDNGGMYCKWGGFLEDVDKFDSLLFNISPREAATMDPQERIFLEAVWTALEDAGYTRAELNGYVRHEAAADVGVFAGVTTYGYHLLASGELQARALLQPWSLANRVSYAFNFHGPSIPVDTACSSSLTAIHLACESLKKGECAVAAAGGVNLYLHPSKYLGMCLIRMLSPTGRCHAFGAGGDGIVPGEGVGAAILKPLSAAVRDRDHIYAVIKGSAVNHGGRTNGYTVPDPAAQAALISRVLEKAAVNPRTISYLEAHGTGTSLGDPIEIAGLARAFGRYTGDKQYCAIGSAKSNIGHLESAAGIAGLTKVALQFKHQRLAPSLHCETLNPNIDFPASPFFVQRELSPWQAPVTVENGVPRKHPRRAGLSSFGAGGANAHIIVEEYQAPPPAPGLGDEPRLIVLSAQNENSLKVYAGELLTFLEKAPGAGRGFEDVREDLTKLAAGLIDIDAADIDPGEEMADCGFDAVHLTELARRIAGRYSLDIPRARLSSHSTIASLAGYIMEQWKERANGAASLDLESMAYTLQAGREPMAERLAVIASDVPGLREKLDRFHQGDRDITDVYTGNIKSDRAGARQIIEGDEGESFIKNIIARGKLAKVAQLWISGVPIDWDLLYPGGAPGRMSLPTYPFAGERHWLREIHRPTGEFQRLHPLVDRMEPGLSLGSGLVFQKTFRPGDRIVQHHRVAGQAILPGVAYLEMARAALCHVNQSNNLRLCGVHWLQPIAVGPGKKEVRIAIRENQGVLQFEILSGSGGQETTHARGECYFAGNGVSPPTCAGSETIGEIISRCAADLDKEEFYGRSKGIGINYGPYFRGVERIVMNRQEALGFLSLPPEFKADIHRFTLQPTLMDAALQTAAVLTGGFLDDREIQPLLPYSVEEVQILNPLSQQCYAHVTAAEGSSRYHVAILDDSGRVCINLREVAFRQSKLPADAFDRFFYRPTWRPAPLANAAETPQEPGKQHVLVVYPGDCAGLAAALAREHQEAEVTKIKLAAKTKSKPGKDLEIDVHDPLALSRCIEQMTHIDRIYFLGGIDRGELQPDRLDSLDESQERGVISLFRLIKGLSDDERGWTGHSLCLKVITNDVYAVMPGEAVRPYSAGLHGLAGSAAKEHPRWRFSRLDISLEAMATSPADEELQALAAAIAAEPGSPAGRPVALRRGKRYEQVLEPLLLAPVSDRRLPLEQRGVYLILGGAGGIGLELAHYLASAFQARLILVGRSRLTDEQKKKIARVEAHGGEVLYVQADAADPDSMAAAVRQGRDRFGPINGAVHSAIVLKDKTLAAMDEETLRAALAPKVRGSAILYKVLRQEPLDFLMFFSSAQSFTCSAGQGNYAAGCLFKDAFALYLNHHTPYPVKIVNWGYWGTVGVVASGDYNHRLASQGAYSITPGQGMEAVRRVLAHRLVQVAPMNVEEQAHEKLGVDRQCRLELYPDDVPSVFDDVITGIQPPPLEAGVGEAFERGFEELRRWARQLLLNAFRQMGVFRQGGVSYDAGQLKRELGVIPIYNRLYQALLDILARAGFIQPQDSGRQIISAGIVDEPELIQALTGLERQRERLAADFPDLAASLRLLWACMEAFPRILAGEIPATQVMFPDSGMELVEGVYKGNAISDYYNRLAARCAREYVRARLPLMAPGETVTILEVGAGTGGTSAFVLEALREYGERLRYIYTDISEGFRKHGQTRFGQQYPFVEFSLLDIETGGEAQGYKPGSVDVAIAANVLHATRDMRVTARNIKALLKTHGWLIINEVTGLHEFTTLTFGLLEGWWLFQDEENRLGGGPLLNELMWERILQEEGMRRVKSLTRPGAGASAIPQHILAAESDGLVKKVVHPRPASSPKRPAKTPDLRPRQPVQQKSIKDSGIKGDTRQYIERKIVECVGEAIGVNPRHIDIEKQFSDYGIDSIIGIELVNKINNALRLVLRTTIIFDYPNAAALSAYIHGNFAEKISPGLTVTGDEDSSAGIDDPLMALLNRLESGELSAAEADQLMETYNG
jgi:polyketide synthase PksN